MGSSVWNACNDVSGRAVVLSISTTSESRLTDKLSPARQILVEAF